MNKRNMQRVLNVLENSYNTIKNKANWTQNAFARTRKGEAVKFSSPRAQKFCAAGAITHFVARELSAGAPEHVSLFISRMAVNAVEKALQRVSHRREYLIDVNDCPRNAHKRVVRAFRDAVKQARKDLTRMF